MVRGEAFFAWSKALLDGVLASLCGKEKDEEHGVRLGEVAEVVGEGL